MQPGIHICNVGCVLHHPDVLSVLLIDHIYIYTSIYMIYGLATCKRMS